jgi:hypothetical protein
MIRTRLAACTLLLLALLAARPAPAAEPFRFPAARTPGGELSFRNGLPVLTVTGSPEDIGAAVGLLALRPSQRTLGYPLELLKEHGAERTYKLFVDGGNGMFRRFPADYQRELEAMVRAAGVNRDDVIVGNTFFDLKKVFACSALLVEPGRSATGGPLLARNLDYPSLGYIHQHTLVTVYRPAGKHAFVSVGFPGLVGCLSGMNDAGLSLAILEVFEVKPGEASFDAEGVPYALCYRRLLEECGTIAEAQKLLEGMHRTTTTNLVVADRDGVAVLEVTPAHVVRRQPPAGGACPCTNHFCSQRLGPEHPIDVCATLERLAELHKSLQGEQKLGPDDLRQRLDIVNLGAETLQTMVFEPRTLKLHLAFGETPSSRLPFRTLDLGPLFKGEK